MRTLNAEQHDTTSQITYGDVVTVFGSIRYHETDYNIAVAINATNEDGTTLSITFDMVKTGDIVSKFDALESQAHAHLSKFMQQLHAML